MVAIHVSFFLLIGLALGSFSTALIYRVPRGVSWWQFKEKKGEADQEVYRSACTHCKKILKPVDLIPLFSWLFSRGRCRYCHEKISLVYPLVELGVVLAVLGIYARFGFSIEAGFIIAAIPFLVALLVIDLQYKILPNALVFIVGILGVLRLFLEGYVFHIIDPALIGMNYILGAFVYAGLSFFLGYFLSKILKKEALGFGDIKFFAVAGLWLGLASLDTFCILAGSLGVVLAIMWQTIKKEQFFPFGPALILSFYLLLLYEGSLLS